MGKHVSRSKGRVDAPEPRQASSEILPAEASQEGKPQRTRGPAAASRRCCPAWADWSAALLVWSSDARFRTTVLVNLSVRLAVCTLIGGRAGGGGPPAACCLEDLSRHTKGSAPPAPISEVQAILERTDEQLLPAVYNFVAAAFDATPEQLGYLTLSRALVQAFASPLGGFLGGLPTAAGIWSLQLHTLADRGRVAITMQRLRRALLQPRHRHLCRLLHMGRHDRRQALRWQALPEDQAILQMNAWQRRTAMCKGP